MDVSKLSDEELREIMSDPEGKIEVSWEGCNVFNGLKILEKYSNNKSLLCATGHDIIYSIGVDTALANGLTRNDAIYLRKQNWMIDEDGFSCFV